MNEYTFETVDGRAVTLVFQNTMLGDVRVRLFNRYADEKDWPDFNIRSDFAWVLAYLVAVRGVEFAIPPAHADLEVFNAAYYAFVGLTDEDSFYGAVRAVNALKTRTDPLEKPDALLTPEEQADPN
jgi:hypothetical protein